MIKAVVYDVDGTVVDSEPLHVKAWDMALSVYNFNLKDLSKKLQSTMAGRKPIENAVDMVTELHLDIKPDTLLQKKSGIFLDLINANIKAMPGLHKSLKGLKQDGYKLGIGTSQLESYIFPIIDALKIHEYFDAIVTGDQISKGKPHPETYQVVARKLGVETDECVVIEDAESGIKSAKAAGCKCIAIKNPNAYNQNLSQADIIISSLAEVTDQFIKLLIRE